MRLSSPLACCFVSLISLGLHTQAFSPRPTSSFLGQRSWSLQSRTRGAFVPQASSIDETEVLEKADNALKTEVFEKTDLSKTEFETMGEMTISIDDVDSEASSVFMWKTIDDEKDDRLLHSVVLAAGTLWWYVYSSIDVWMNPADFFGLPTMVVDACAIYITLSQVLVYGLLYKLTSSNSLREAQMWVLGCIFLCVPADCMIVMFDPTGSQFATVSAFTLVTLFYGVYLAHYLRLAAVREEKMKEPVQLQRYQESEPEGPIEELLGYRPPMQLQSFYMAIDFARSFVAFTLAVAAFREAIIGDEAASVILLVSCGLVAFHSTIQMFLTTLFPGNEVEDYDVFLWIDALLCVMDIIAASVISQGVFQDNIWDELLYSWLFGNATADLFQRLSQIFRDTDFDAKLGLSKSD